MRGHWEFTTRKGTFSIRQSQDGRWHPWFRDEDLGSYWSPEQALDDVSGGHTFTPSCGDTSRLGLPEDLSEWTFVPSR